MEFRYLKDKIAVVTGATEGIGLAITNKLIADGMRVIAIARNETNLANLKQQHGDRIHTVALDVGDAEAVQALPSQLPTEWQHVYALINNAGTTGPAKPLDEVTPAEIARITATNINGPAFLCKAFLPELRKQKGHIVNIGSIAGDNAYITAHMYGASKAALEQLSNNIRYENIIHGIRVTLIKPGSVRTHIHRKRFEHDLAMGEQVMGSPNQLEAEDVAGSIAYCLKQPPGVSIDELTINATGSHFGRGTERFTGLPLQ